MNKPSFWAAVSTGAFFVIMFVMAGALLAEEFSGVDIVFWSIVCAILAVVSTAWHIYLDEGIK